MALRPAAERQARIDEFRRRFPGRTPPVDVEPPGIHAPPPDSSRRFPAVRRIIDEHRAEMARLDVATMRQLEPVFKQAERELGARLHQWVETTPDGELRWNAQHYRAALAQAKAIRLQLGDALGIALEEGMREAEELAVRHLESELARFSAVFTGTPLRLRLNMTRALAEGDSFIIPRIRSSLARYSSLGDTGTSVYEDIRRRLAVDIAKGASVYETTERLVEHGGPRGWVSIRGIAGEGGELEYIPEGLFRRYRYWAERIVRTENASAAGFVRREGLKQAHEKLPHLRRKWFADPSACTQICRPLDGQVADVAGMFATKLGSIEHEPAHPNCTCTTTPWADDWDELLGDLRSEPKGEPPEFESAPPRPRSQTTPKRLRSKIPGRATTPDAVPGIASQAPGSLERLLREREFFELAPRRTERALAYTPDGQLLLDMVGTPDSVGRGGLNWVALKDAFVTHNHPDHSSFSDGDVETAVKKNLSQIRVVAEPLPGYLEGKTYLHVMTRPAEGWPDLDDVREVARRWFQTLDAELTADMRAGRVNLEVGLRRLLHRWWQEVASELQLSYERVILD